VIWLIAALLLASTLLAACGAPTTNQQTSLFAAATVAPTTTGSATPTAMATLTPTAAPPTNIATPTVAPIPQSSLPTLASQAGWHTVLTLSDTTGAHGGDIQQQNFIAAKPYIILYSCKGSGGALKVIYQDTVGGAYCDNPPRINRTKTLTSTQPDHSAFVTVSPMGNIIWELLVEMQD
jgi:hypothetical protein